MNHVKPLLRTVLVLSLVVLTGFASLGCSRTYVGHLPQAAWSLGSPMFVRMKLMDVNFSAVPMTDAYGVRGEVRLRPSALPAAAREGQVDEFWLAAYLCDAKGAALAQDLRVFTPRPVSDQPVSFEFILRPDRLEPGPLFIAFGHRLVVSSPELKAPFFADEGALVQR